MTDPWARLRQLLNRPVRVDQLIEAAVWLALPYLLVGLVLTFTQPATLVQVRSQMQLRAPQSAGFDLVAFGVAVTLWPALLVTPGDCD